MKYYKLLFGFMLLSCFLMPSSLLAQQDSTMLVRIAELEIYPEHVAAYKEILKIEAEASVRLESGVIGIFPMYQRDDSTQIRILEIYANDKAYEEHLKTAHFLEYKKSTLKMVKTLKLLDMDMIDSGSLYTIFRKARREEKL